MKPTNSTINLLYLFVASFYITIYVSQFKSTNTLGAIENKKQLKLKKKKYPKKCEAPTGNSIKPKNGFTSKQFTDKKQIEDAKQLYLNEKYLRVVRLANSSVDSKLGVDRPTKKPIQEVLDALDLVNENCFNDASRFVDEYLHEPGFEIVMANFTDWTPAPKYIDSINSESLRKFSYSLNNIWLDLYKKIDLTLLSHGAVSSHLPMKHPFIVPGGRFIETYYWDNFWILEGLLVSGMFETGKTIIENHMHLVEEYGFIPNGSRVYYLNRSQPPYFSLMVMAFYEKSMKSSELTFEEKYKYKRFVLDEALEYMIKEYKYWMKERSILIKHNGLEFKLNIFNPTNDKPRPESYSEDIHTASQCQNEIERAKLYKDISAGAESGIDFSSRWFKEPDSIHTIHTTDIVPIDLNALLYKIETNIAKLCTDKGDYAGFKRFRNQAAKRKSILNSLMWSKKLNCWADYNHTAKKLNEDNFYITNLSPLFMDIKPPRYRVKDIIDKHFCSLNLNDTGIPYSFTNSSQQWDYSNVWAPNQYEMIMMLSKHNRELALKFARKFFNTVYTGWLKTGLIFEKYSSSKIGERGTGGEYEVQSGFGWTNGTIITLLDIFKDELIS